MKTRTILMISLVLNAGLLGGVAFLAKQGPQDFVDGRPVAEAADRVVVASAQESGAVRFGPVFEAALPGLLHDGKPELYDLEKGQRAVEPDFESFNRIPQANAAWIRLTGLDLSGVGGADQIQGCVCYYMAVVPCSSNIWETISASDVLASSELAAIKDPKRSCLFSREESTCYLFRTHEGTSGVLLLPAASEAGSSLRIRYKLVTGSARDLAQPSQVSPRLSRS